MRNGIMQVFAIGVALASAPGAGAIAVTHKLTDLTAFVPRSAEAEATLARSAAPASVSSAADVLVFGPKGYSVHSKGNNGFVCYVERSWAKEPGDPEFWNPRVRAPMCVNPAAVRSVLRSYLEKTKWVLAGLTEAQIRDRIQGSVRTGKFSPPAAGAMSYMMSKEQYLQDDGGHPWRPHVMFFFPSSVASRSWAADLKESPILSDRSAKLEQVVVFMLPVARWSDGSPAAIFPSATTQ